MFLKPKHTYLDQPALHYKKVIDLTKYLLAPTYYYYTSGSVNKLYVYDRDKKEFVLIESDYGNGIAIDTTKKYTIDNVYWQYNSVLLKWEQVSVDSAEDIITALDYRNQKNRYIKNKAFDYIVISEINESAEQIHKGLISQHKSFDIKYTDDDVYIDDDDIVQIDNELFMVSDSSYKIVRLPKPYKTYFCTLNRLNTPKV